MQAAFWLRLPIGRSLCEYGARSTLCFGGVTKRNEEHKSRDIDTYKGLAGPASRYSAIIGGCFYRACLYAAGDDRIAIRMVPAKIC